MATPLLSPVVNNNAIAALQIAADGSSTPYRPSCSRAVAVLLFSASTKRQPSP
jgi:predicted phosphoribosyltransferase